MAPGTKTTPRRPTMAFRVHRDLLKQVRQVAKANKRSMSAEIERRLERSFAAEPSDFQVKMEEYMISIRILLERINANSRQASRKFMAS